MCQCKGSRRSQDTETEKQRLALQEAQVAPEVQVAQRHPGLLGFPVPPWRLWLLHLQELLSVPLVRLSLLVREDRRIQVVPYFPVHLDFRVHLEFQKVLEYQGDRLSFQEGREVLEDPVVLEAPVFP